MDQTETVQEIAPVYCATDAQIANRFTKENAREMAARSAAKRRERDEADAKAQADAAKPDPQLDAYVASQLVRVRAHLARLDAQIDKATDPQDLERLARARRVFAQTEQELAGRPLPGSRRPGKERAVAPGAIEPL